MKNLIFGLLLSTSILGTSAYASDNCCQVKEKSCCSKKAPKKEEKKETTLKEQGLKQMNDLFKSKGKNLF